MVYVYVNWNLSPSGEKLLCIAYIRFKYWKTQVWMFAESPIQQLNLQINIYFNFHCSCLVLTNVSELVTIATPQSNTFLNLSFDNEGL